MAISDYSDYSYLVWSGFEIEDIFLHQFICLQCTSVCSMPIFYNTTLGAKHIIYLRVVLRVYYHNAAPGEVNCLVREAATFLDIC